MIEYALIVGGVGLVAFLGLMAVNQATQQDFVATQPANGVVTNCAAGDTSCSALGALPPKAVPDPTGLSAPVLTGTAASTQVTLTWTVPANVGSAIIDYTVTGTPGGTCTTVGTTCTINGLLNGTQYTFRVAARNATGIGPVSNAVTLTPNPPTPPGPAALFGTAGNAQAVLTWSAVTSGGLPIIDYTVTGSPGGTCTVLSTLTTCTITGLTNGIEYTFTVAARNALGVGQASNAVALTPSGPPSKPTGVTGTAGDKQVAVTWTAPGNDGGSPILGYTVTSAPGGLTCSGTDPAVGCTVNGLTNGTAYTFTVTATNAIGTGPASDPSAAVTPKGVPDKPTGVTGAPGNGQVSVTWTAPVGNGGSAILDYTVTSAPGNKTCTATVPAVTCIVTGLTNGTAYTFTVVARNAQGPSLPSAPSAAVTPAGACQPLGLQTLPFTSGSSPFTVNVLASLGGGSISTLTPGPGSTDGSVAKSAGSPNLAWTISGNSAKEWNGSFTYTSSFCIGTGSGSVKFTKPAGFNP